MQTGIIALPQAGKSTLSKISIETSLEDHALSFGAARVRFRG